MNSKATHYNVLAVGVMSADIFASIIVSLIEAAHNHYDPETEVELDWEFQMQVVSYQCAVFFAQRYDAGVPTDDVMELLQVTKRMTCAERQKLVETFMSHF